MSNAPYDPGNAFSSNSRWSWIPSFYSNSPWSQSYSTKRAENTSEKWGRGISHCICKGNPPNPLYIKGIPYINAMGNAPSPLFSVVLGTFCVVTLWPRGVRRKTGYLGPSRLRGERVSGPAGRIGHLFLRVILAPRKKVWFISSKLKVMIFEIFWFSSRKSKKIWEFFRKNPDVMEKKIWFFRKYFFCNLECFSDLEKSIAGR